jgi:hypothetical protein
MRRGQWQPERTLAAVTACNAPLARTSAWQAHAQADPVTSMGGSGYAGFCH